MEEKKDLWKLVRKKLEKNSELATKNFTDNEKTDTVKVEKSIDNINESDESSPSKYINDEKVDIDNERKPLLEQGIFAVNPEYKRTPRHCHKTANRKQEAPTSNTDSTIPVRIDSVVFQNRV